MASSHNLHPREAIDVEVDTYPTVSGAYIGLRVDEEEYTIHFESIGQAFEFASRIYDAAYKLALRKQTPSQITETEKTHGSTTSS